MRRVLLVDDIEGVLLALRAMLTITDDADVQSVGNPLEVTDDQLRWAEIILTDYMMPGMDGCQLLERAARVNPHATGYIITAMPTFLVDCPIIPHSRVISKPPPAGTFREILQL